MAEQRITIEIDESGKISATTSGLKGELCLSELEDLLGTLEDYGQMKKTDEYYQQASQQNQNSQQNKRS